MSVPLVEENGSKIGADGLPDMTDEQRAAGYKKGLTMITVLFMVPRVICAGIAVPIYHFGDQAFYNSQITKLTEMQWGYLYVAVGVFSVLVGFLNMWPAAVKGKVMGRDGNLRANMAIFKVNVQEGQTQLPYVVMEEKGAVGEYNRANRSLFHFNENVSNVVLNLVFGGGVFPFPTMVIMILFALGRIMHQVGYAQGGYGKHARGFAISSTCSTIMECLVWIVAAKSLGAF